MSIGDFRIHRMNERLLLPFAFLTLFIGKTAFAKINHLPQHPENWAPNEGYYNGYPVSYAPRWLHHVHFALFVIGASRRLPRSTHHHDFVSLLRYYIDDSHAQATTPNRHNGHHHHH